LPLGLLGENCCTGRVLHFEQAIFVAAMAGAESGASAAF
jgi:hypothetical protein